MKTAPRQLVRQYLNKRPDSQARLQEAAERGESPTSPVRHKAAHAKNAIPISDPVDSMLLPPFGGRQERVRILESLSAKWEMPADQSTCVRIEGPGLEGGRVVRRARG